MLAKVHLVFFLVTAGTCMPHADEEMNRWDGGSQGSAITLDFKNLAPDMLKTFQKSFLAWDYDGTTVSERMKQYVELPVSAIPDGKGKVKIFGFTSGPDGLVNTNQNRFWTDEPTMNGAALIYGFILEGIPETNQWTYNFSFAKAPPTSSDFKIAPADGKVYQQDNAIFLRIECNSPQTCTDGSFVISSVTLAPLPVPILQNQSLSAKSPLITGPFPYPAGKVADANLVPKLEEKHAEKVGDAPQLDGEALQAQSGGATKKVLTSSSGVEWRIARDGVAYTQQEFIDYFGDAWQREWDTARQVGQAS